MGAFQIRYPADVASRKLFTCTLLQENKINFHFIVAAQGDEAIFSLTTKIVNQPIDRQAKK